MTSFKPYRYEKDYNFDQFLQQVNWKFFIHAKLIWISMYLLSALLFLTQVIIPLYFFKTSDEIKKPIADTVLGAATGFSDFEFSELKKDQTGKSSEVNVPKYFYITIPKLRIKDAKVESNSPTLNPDTSLGHYNGTQLPGEAGNILIYGHSVLPVFYNPRNYRTIFSTLGDLQAGDEIQVKYNNKEFIYKVETKIIMDPTKIDPLAKVKPAYLNETTITLMTCWPAGLKTKRLMVEAVQVN